ncbi:unnamed protein product [marine sediment metagenome]|uniref:Uncharacterized protein n=1 Tax=marine sediment metagenome TaxID=412755 RepID=X0X6M9_9ZZZZ
MFGFRKIWQELQKHGRHIAIINDEMGEVQKNTKHIPVMRNNIKWLMRLVCAIFLAVAVGLLQQFFGIFGI